MVDAATCRLGGAALIAGPSVAFVFIFLQPGVLLIDRVSESPKPVLACRWREACWHPQQIVLNADDARLKSLLVLCKSRFDWCW